MHVIGPITGGLFYTINGSMSKTCFCMFHVGAYSLGAYFISALFVFCTVNHENDLKLDEDLSGTHKEDHSMVAHQETIRKMFSISMNEDDPDRQSLLKEIKNTA